MYEVAHVRRGADLTLVDARVAVLRVLDLQRPLVRVRVMDGPEPLVACVRVPADGQQVDIAVPHPRNLQHIPNQPTLENLRSLKRIDTVARNSWE